MPGAGQNKRHHAMNMLLEKANIQGYLTTDDLMEAFPDANQDAEYLSVLLTSLRQSGVEPFRPPRDSFPV